MLKPIDITQSFLYATYYRHNISLLWVDICDGICDSGIREFCFEYSVINSVQDTTQENRNANSN